MNKEFIPRKESFDLRELGFDKECVGTYTEFGGLELYRVRNQPKNEKSALAPLYQQAFRWFREKYNLCCYVVCYELAYEIGHYFSFEIPIEDSYYNEHFNTYEEAELALLIKLIEIAKNK